MPFTKPPQLEYLGAGNYRTSGPTIYQGDRESIVIPPGFNTDLASVPRIFWAVLPPCGAYEKAAVLHDLLCVELGTRYRHHIRTPPQVNARDTDGLFRRVMREEGVGLLTRWAMFVGVRWGALFNPARRAGWWRDSPAVVGITALGLAATLCAVLAVHLAVDALLSLVL